LFIANHQPFSLSLSLRQRKSKKYMKNLLLKELNVFQSVTPHLSFGGEVFWAGQHRKSGIGYAARYNTDKMVCWPQFVLIT
jgi:mitochondrial import receptor subunit TOM40